MSFKGYKHTTASKAKMSIAKKGRKQTAEHTAKLVASRTRKGYRHTDETKAKMSVAHKGRKFTAVHRANLRAAMKKMRTAMKKKGGCVGCLTPETKAKISMAMKGNKNCAGRKCLPQTRAKQSIIMKSHWASPEYRARGSGLNAPNWQGGRGNEPYPPGFNEALKKAIRLRDGYICQECGKTQKQNGKALEVHHKNGNKDNLELDNLISLCVSCHVKIPKLRQA